MKPLVIHKELVNNIHEIQITGYYSDAISQIIRLSKEIFIQNTEHHCLLINATQAQILPLRILANELRRVAAETGQVKASIAIVIDRAVFNEQMNEMIKTILARDSVELFTDLNKGKFWLQLEQKRKANQLF